MFDEPVIAPVATPVKQPALTKPATGGFDAMFGEPVIAPVATSAK
jgi:hypothetical protein